MYFELGIAQKISEKRRFLREFIFILFCLSICQAYISNVFAEDAKQTEDTTNDSDDEDDDEFLFKEENDVYDPFEKMNRFTYALNSAFDRAIFAPLARGYRAAVPKWTQKVIGNAVNTYFAPLRCVNFVLQGEGKQAAKTVFRFFFNMVFGFFGAFDAAKVVGVTSKNTSFGQTFKKWGMRPGPYFILPLFGPSSMRGSLGQIFDFPLTSLSDDIAPLKTQKMKTRIRYIMTGTDLLVARVNTLDVLDDIEKMSVDPYVATRSAIMAIEK